MRGYWRFIDRAWVLWQAGLWIHLHPKLALFAIGLVATLLGGWMGGTMEDSQVGVNIGALVGGGVIVATILCVAIGRRVGKLYPMHALRQSLKSNPYRDFTARARMIMRLTEQEAQRLNHEYIGTEHILLGMVKEGSGIAAEVLGKFDLRKIRLEIERIVQSGPDMITMGRLPKTPRAKNLIACAYAEAQASGHALVDVEHLLLGLLCDSGTVAYQVLRNLGADPNRLRQEVMTLMSQESESKDETP
jgi:hypothetical protein